jgi:hypothetical protein
MCQYDAHAFRYRKSHNLNRIERAHEDNSSVEGRSNVVEMPSRNSFLGDKTAGEQRRHVERIPEQLISGYRARNRRRSASALTSGKRQSFPHTQGESLGGMLHTSQSRGVEDGRCGECRCVARGIDGQVRVSRILEGYTGSMSPLGGHLVARTREGAADDVQTGA